MELKKVLVLGMGVSGCSAASFLLSLGASVYVHDEKAHFWKEPQLENLKSQGIQIFDPVGPFSQKTFDTVIVSPGISPNNALYRKALHAGIDVIGEAELACKFISSPCIGVTGTNGKTTVTMLIAHVLNQNGIAAKPVGNIGVPLTSLVADSKKALEKTVLVIELSSYQLETMKSKVLDAALLLNITPDHLERHHNMEGYATVKARIFDCLKLSGRGYVSTECLSDWSSMLERSFLSIFDGNQPFLEKLHQNCLRRISPYEASNYLAAYAICLQWGISDDQFLASIETFVKPPHRVEWVRNFRGVDFVDDSKGTNIDAVVKAVESIEGPIILIAGGVDKGASYTPWIVPLKSKVRFMCTVGAAASKMYHQLSSTFPIQHFNGLEEAVHFAAELAERGDTVLLSPGCASYDMFIDYEHRGREFKRIVHEL